MIYLVINTGAQATTSAVDNWIHLFEIPQSIVHNRGAAFIKTDFINWTKELGITLRHRTAHYLGLTVKSKPKTNKLPVTGGTS